MFNIDKASIIFPEHQDISKAIIQKSNFGLLILNINQNDQLFTMNSETNLVKISFINLNQLPTTLKAEINCVTGKLLFDLLTPIKGIAILDNNDNIVSNEHTFLLDNLSGFRILSFQNTFKEPYLKLYNPKHEEIKIQIPLKSSLVSLRNFESTIQKLFYLGEIMSPSNEVIIELGRKNYRIKLYNNQVLKRKLDEDKIELYLENKNTIDELYAIPLECPEREISIINLKNSEQGFAFPDQLSKYPSV